MGPGPHDKRERLPELFGERVNRISSLLDESHVHPRDAERLLEKAADEACTFLQEVMAAGPFTLALQTVERMTPQDAATTLERVTGDRFEEFMRLELQLLVDAGVAAPNAERILMQCRDALGVVDPELIRGGPAIKAFIYLRRETCHVAEQQRLRNRALVAELESAHREKVGRAILNGVAGVAVGTVDFSVLPTVVGPLFAKASGLVATAMCQVANSLFPPRGAHGQGGRP